MRNFLAQETKLKSANLKKGKDPLLRFKPQQGDFQKSTVAAMLVHTVQTDVSPLSFFCSFFLSFFAH